MKAYKVEYTERAVKDLRKLDKYTRNLIVAWIEKNLVNCNNPRIHGKVLIKNKSGKWRYRIGNYRLICEIQDDRIVILILEIGHRREIYD
ncbi:MAG: type II toxin-antitoxin system RelE/ParE family toxin [Clostridia bacterium]|nr:type II toxin-antitoxin system RelE/ParE family toxin [Clostridia bacterium]